MFSIKIEKILEEKYLLKANKAMSAYGFFCFEPV